MRNELNSIKRQAEEIASQWNGDEPGLAEDRAHVATDILKKCEELSELLNEIE